MNLPVLWLSTIIVKNAEDDAYDDPSSDSRLTSVLSWLGGAERSSQSAQHVIRDLLSGTMSPCNERLFCQVEVSPPSSNARQSFFNPFFSALPTLPHTLLVARMNMFRAQNQVLKVAEKPANAGGGPEETAMARLNPRHISDRELERDRHYFREQRLFFRAALGQLFKEKRYYALSRPVEPEQVSVVGVSALSSVKISRMSYQVPDYYDIVKAPMDLETMRAKVDAHLYPTYDHFIYDIEQIVHNAKLYNPVDGSSRGRSIVSAANQMLDAVESHAYHNVQIMKYNVFKKCKEAYYERYYINPPPPKPINQEVERNNPGPRRYSFRNSTAAQQDTVRPPPKKKSKVVYDSRGDNAASDINYLRQNRNKMPSENLEYYEHIFERHKEISEALDDGSDVAVMNGTTMGQAHDILEFSESNGGDNNANYNENDDSEMVVVDEINKDATPSPNCAPSFYGEQVVDLENCPLVKALQEAIIESRRSDVSIKNLLRMCVAKTNGWNVAQLVSLFSGIPQTS